GIAADRLTLLRRAFQLAVEDPELKADAEKQRLALDPTPGDEAERVIKALYATPASVVERMRRIVAVPSEEDQMLIDILFIPIVGNGIRPLVGHGVPDAFGHRVPLLNELILGGGDLREQAAELIARRPIARDHRGGILQVVRDRLRD